MTIRSKVIYTPTDRDDLLGNILGGLDPNEHIVVTLITQNGVEAYRIVFNNEQTFDEHTNSLDDLRVLDLFMKAFGGYADVVV